MKSLEIESWTLRILEQVENRLPVEDSRVELKSAWLDPVKTARRLAGHANAARGEPILWLIGADEKQGTVVGAQHQDLSAWWPQVRACFESEVPALHDLNVTYKTKTVVALCFETSRFPFLVKNPKGGEIQYEVPWRDGTAVRTATRSDLVLMVGPLLRVPKLEVLRAEMRFFVPKPANLSHPYLGFKVQCYAVPLDTFPLTFPLHKCSAVMSVPNAATVGGFKMNLTTSQTASEEKLNLMKARSAIVKGDFVGAMTRTHPEAGAIERTSDEMVIRGPGKMNVLGEVHMASAPNWPEVEIAITLVEVVTDFPVGIKLTLVRKGSKDDEFLWVQKQ